MDFWYGAPLLGMLSAVVMSIFLKLLSKLGITHVDMVKSLGSLFVKRAFHAGRVGFVVHLVMGAFFGCLYILLWAFFDFSTLKEFLLVGAIFGLGHGIAFAAIMVILVGEHHPIKQFRKVGFNVAIGYLLAHIVYGVTLGGLVASSNLKWEPLRENVRKISPAKVREF